MLGFSYTGGYAVGRDIASFCEDPRAWNHSMVQAMRCQCQGCLSDVEANAYGVLLGKGCS
jgi:hypothetical protein